MHTRQNIHFLIRLDLFENELKSNVKSPQMINVRCAKCDAGIFDAYIFAVLRWVGCTYC